MFNKEGKAAALVSNVIQWRARCSAAAHGVQRRGIEAVIVLVICTAILLLNAPF